MKTLKLGFLTALCLLIGACNEAALKSAQEGNQESNLTIKLTDAPFQMDVLEKVEVEISKIDMRHNDEFKTLHEGFVTYDILKLRGGLTETLVQTPIEPGKIDLIRLFIESATVTMKDGRVFDMFVPSGAQTGLKLFIDPTIDVVTGNLSYELTLDFDISQSFIPLGNPNSAEGITGFNFKPVIRVANNSVHGRVTGKILSDMCSSDFSDDDLPINMATVQALQDGQVIASAGTDADGNFALIGLEPGTYNIVMEASKHNQAAFISEVYVANDTQSGSHVLAGKCVTINGSVFSDNGTAEDLADDYLLEGAWVELYDANNNFLAEVKTGIEGSFEFAPQFEGDFNLAILEDEQADDLHYDGFVELMDYTDSSEIEVVLEKK